MSKLIKKIKYGFDNIMARGTAVMLAVLSLFMIAGVFIITLAINLGGLSEDEEMGYTLWDVLATTINAWMPSSEDGGLGYILLIALSAILGLFFTSFLIGIISSAIEDKLSQLRKGNSDIVESNHIVILGFDPGKYTLINQLVLAANNVKKCIVVAEEMDKEEMEELIKDNVDLPNKVKLVCRNINITDPLALSKCSLETAELIVVNPIEDERTIKTILAAAKSIEECENKPRIVTTVMGEEYYLPEYTMEKMGISLLRTDEILSRIIAHSCTQSGLANAFFEVFNFEGNEFYIEDMLTGVKTWGELTVNMINGVPVGIIRNDVTQLNPSWDTELKSDDKLIVFEKNKQDYRLSDSMENVSIEADAKTEINEGKAVMVIGNNEKLELILRELPDDINEISMIGLVEDEMELLNNCNENGLELRMTYDESLIMDAEGLEAALDGISHIIILAEMGLSQDAADMKIINTLIRLKDIRERCRLSFNITAEMNREDNRTLVADDDIIDFIVSSDMSSMVLTQVAVTAQLKNTFLELLSNDGNEFSLLSAGSIGLAGNDMDIKNIRRRLLKNSCLLLGYIDNTVTNAIYLNPDVNMVPKLSENDKLIVICEKAIINVKAPAFG